LRAVPTVHGPLVVHVETAMVGTARNSFA
jgi:hypothetical protein